MTSKVIWAAAFGAALATAWAPSAAFAVTKTPVTVNGLKASRFAWTDSHGLPRTVSIKREGSGNPGHGGYAIQMTYQYVVGGKTKTLTANPPDAGEGFGYFVSHERFRKFNDGGDDDSIGSKIFGKDDSPLGRNFAAVGADLPTVAGKMVYQIKVSYPRYGTIAKGGIDPDTGEDKPPLGTDKALFKLYQLPVTITWVFQDGRDYPRIRTEVSLTELPGPDRTSFDLRGPYGKLDFDGGDNDIVQVRWADRYFFATTTSPLTRNSSWTWNSPNQYARFTSLTAGAFEMGLMEPRPFAETALNDGYSDGRGKTSQTYNDGTGCAFQDQKIPCDYEWPYQSSQYELPYDNPNGTTNSEKIAWGSTPYYGMTMDSTYDGTTAVPFVGFPSNKRLRYEVCVVLGRTVDGGLTRKEARRDPKYNCADAP